LLPLQLGSPDDFEVVRNFLMESEFTARRLCELLGVEALHEVLGGKGSPRDSERESRLGVLAELFVLGRYVASTRWKAAVPDRVSEAMARLGLIESGPGPDGRLVSPVMLAPSEGLVLVSDRHCSPDRRAFRAPQDAVYPAVTKATGEFLRLLPGTLCRRLLDLCCGTGVAAILAAATGRAEQAWAADILPRAAHFARFNSRLNGTDNVTVVEGDLYEPVAGLEFDRIVAHPPYVPALQSQWVFRDAGETGEEISRGIVRGCREALAPGGRCYCLTTGLDLEDSAFEERVRGWLGEESGSFDLLLVEIDTFPPEAMVSSLALRGQRTPQEARQLLEHFRRLGVRAFCHGMLVLQKKAAPARPSFAERYTAGPLTGAPEIEWLMSWLSNATAPGFEETLLSSVYRASPRIVMALLHRFDQGRLAVSEIRLETDYPFRVETRIQPWTAQMLAECARPRTGREIYEFCRKQGLIHEGISAVEFTALLRSLVGGGFLEMEGFRTPAAEE